MKICYSTSLDIKTIKLLLKLSIFVPKLILSIYICNGASLVIQICYNKSQPFSDYIEDGFGKHNLTVLTFTVPI